MASFPLSPSLFPMADTASAIDADLHCNLTGEPLPRRPRRQRPPALEGGSASCAASATASSHARPTRRSATWAGRPGSWPWTATCPSTSSSPSPPTRTSTNSSMSTTGSPPPPPPVAADLPDPALSIPGGEFVSS